MAVEHGGCDHQAFCNFLHGDGEVRQQSLGRGYIHILQRLPDAFIPDMVTRPSFRGFHGNATEPLALVTGLLKDVVLFQGSSSSDLYALFFIAEWLMMKVLPKPSNAPAKTVLTKDVFR